MIQVTSDIDVPCDGINSEALVVSAKWSQAECDGGIGRASNGNESHIKLGSVVLEWSEDQKQNINNKKKHSLACIQN